MATRNEMIHFINLITADETETLFELMLEELNISQICRLLNEHCSPTDAAEIIAHLEE